MYLSTTVPFVYLIGWSQLNKFYFGSRYGKGCHPRDLWTLYYTSSFYVKRFYKKHGDPDIIIIQQTFINPKDALAFERKLLRRMNAAKDPRFLNRSNGAGTFIGKPGPRGPNKNKRILTEEHKARIGAAMTGKKRKPRGPPTEETKAKCRATMKSAERVGIEPNTG